ncbi:hypothetical protein [Methanospirillum lacunae]
MMQSFDLAKINNGPLWIGREEIMETQVNKYKCWCVHLIQARSQRDPSEI